MDQALTNLIGLLGQAAALLTDLQADRATQATALAGALAERDAERLKWSDLNRQVNQLTEKLAGYPAHPDVVAARIKALIQQQDATQAELDRLRGG